MKVIIIISLFFSSLLLLSCATYPKIQVYHTYARIIKIDTAYRGFEKAQLEITWQSDGIEYISFAPLECRYYSGMIMPVLLRR